jgi:putative hydrolase of the HAD superfamily
MLNPTIIFDYDDTIGGVKFPDGSIRSGAAAYFDCIENFVQMATRRGFEGARARELQHTIDIDLVKTHGFGDKTRFAQSMRLAYQQVSAGEDPNGEDDAYKIGMSVFTDYPYTALPGALDVLKYFAEDYRIAVVTKGEYNEQLRKLNETGVVGLVDSLFIVDRKDDHDWQETLKALDFAPIGYVANSDLHWAVGNSAKADVNPLVARGFNGIHITGMNGWSYEQEELLAPLPGRRSVATDDIRNITSIIPLLSKERNHGKL